MKFIPGVFVCALMLCGVVACSSTKQPSFCQPPAPNLPEGFVYADQYARHVRTHLKYNGYDNFVGRPLDGYHGNRPILRVQAAQALAKVADDLYRQGYVVIIYDAYRPHTAVLDIYRWCHDLKDQKMKAEYYPGIAKERILKDCYVRDFSEHSRGVALDVSLLSAKDGKPVDMGGHHDLLDPSSATESVAVTPAQRRNRLVLKRAFEKYGFVNYAPEWWHYRLQHEPAPADHYYFPVWDGMESSAAK